MVESITAGGRGGQASYMLASLFLHINGTLCMRCRSGNSTLYRSTAGRFEVGTKTGPGKGQAKVSSGKNTTRKAKNVHIKINLSRIGFDREWMLLA